MDIDSARQLVSAAMYCGNQGTVRDLHVSGPVYTGHNSVIYKVVSSSLPFDGALKFCLKSRTRYPDQQGAEQQFLTLRRVSDAMLDESRYSVPRPMLFFPDDAAYLVEWVSGKNASAGLFDKDAVLADLEYIIFESARWLSCFHRCHQAGTGRLDVRRKLTALEQMVSSNNSGNRFFIRAFDRLVYYAGAASLPELQRSWLHGDFKSDNIIVNTDRVVGIDIQAETENFVVYDIASFINHIDLNAGYLKRNVLRKNKSNFYENFVRAYFLRSSDDLMLSVAWARAHRLMVGWCRARQPRSSAFRTAFLQWQFKSSIHNALQDLEWYGR